MEPTRLRRGSVRERKRAAVARAPDLEHSIRTQTKVKDPAGGEANPKQGARPFGREFLQKQPRLAKDSVLLTSFGHAT